MTSKIVLAATEEVYRSVMEDSCIPRLERAYEAYQMCHGDIEVGSPADELIQAVIEHTVHYLWEIGVDEA